MADRKSRSVTFALPYRGNLKDLKAAIENEISGEITVFQELGNEEYLVECVAKEDAETLIEQGFDYENIHVGLHPPQGKLVNVSIMGLRSYIDDEDVKEALNGYGELRSEVIRLKYKSDHDLAGLENGNRLVKMVLEKKSIPYSIRIAGEWCRIIHNNQQPVCTECQQLGHTRKHCPSVKCRICNELGHMSYNCNKKDTQTSNTELDTENNEEQNSANDLNEANPDDTIEQSGDRDPALPESNNQGLSQEEMECEQKGLKRQHITDSDSDNKTPNRRQKINPMPNLEASRKKEHKPGARSSTKSKDTSNAT